ncbi:MAG: hypothetical protein Q9200_001106 [Gallowayella weberi]
MSSSPGPAKEDFSTVELEHVKAIMSKLNWKETKLIHPYTVLKSEPENLEQTILDAIREEGSDNFRPTWEQLRQVGEYIWKETKAFEGYVLVSCGFERRVEYCQEMFKTRIKEINSERGDQDLKQGPFYNSDESEKRFEQLMKTMEEAFKALKPHKPPAYPPLKSQKTFF